MAAQEQTIAERLNQIEEREKEISLKEKSSEEEMADLDAKRSELAEQEQTIAERLNQIEEREKEISLREKSLEEASANLEAKRSELAAQEQTITERLNQIEEQVHKRAIDILKIAQSIAKDRDNE